MRKFILSFFISLALHGAILVSILWKFSIVSNNDMGGLNADIGEFAGIILVSNLPQDELKQMSFEQVRAQKSENEVQQEELESVLEPKKDEAIIKENEPDPIIRLQKAVKIAPKSAVSKKIDRQNIERIKSDISGEQNSAKKDDVASAPTIGTASVSSTPIMGNGGANVKSYKGLLMEHLNHYKRYPLSALNAKQEGAAKVLVAINSGGKVLDAVLKNSSGYVSLDNETLELFKRASPLPVPSSELLKGRNELKFNIVIDFNIAKYLNSVR